MDGEPPGTSLGTVHDYGDQALLLEFEQHRRGIGVDRRAAGGRPARRARHRARVAHGAGEAGRAALSGADPAAAGKLRVDGPTRDESTAPLDRRADVDDRRRCTTAPTSTRWPGSPA